MTATPMLVVLALSLGVASPAAAQRFMYTGMPDADVVAFLGKLQQAVGAGDRAAVAGMVLYPLRVNRDSARHTLVASRAELLRRYDAVFTPAIRRAIVTETAATLTGGLDGAGIKAGLVWISGVCDSRQLPRCRLGVASVNLHDER